MQLLILGSMSKATLSVFKSAAVAGGEPWEEGGCHRWEKTNEFQIIQIIHHV